MDIKHSLETDDGTFEIYINATKDDLNYLQRLSLMYLIDNGMFPFHLLSAENACNFHNSPEMIQ